MRAELVTIGDEICRGEIVNTNASWLGAALWERQITVTHMTSCRDDPEDMKAALSLAASRSELVLVSGGLGPTVDDRTVDIVSELVGVDPVIDSPAEESLRERWQKTGRPMHKGILRQVRVPKGSKVYGNPVGLAPSFEVSLAGCPLICLPGPPRELRGIFEAHLDARLEELRSAQGGSQVFMAQQIVRAFGAGESELVLLLEGMKFEDGASLHYQVKFPETLIKVVVYGDSEQQVESHLHGLISDVSKRLGVLHVGNNGDSMASVVVSLLQSGDKSVAVAESCTAGMMGALIADVSGCSSVFLGGAITYSNEEKERQLGVKEATLKAHGAVSEAVAEEMAMGIRTRTNADYAVAITGIAGPGGGSEQKPVGTVCVAVSGPTQTTSRSYCYPSSRDQVRRLAAYQGLDALRRMLLVDMSKGVTHE